MGIGIWSMHFVGMLAFNVPGITIAYDVPLLLLSILVAVLASALALYIICMRQPTALSYWVGSFMMGSAIAGMHYIGIWSMRMAASIEWDYLYVLYSLLIAFAASYAALVLAFKLREDLTLQGFLYRGGGGVLMGFAIAGMHYTGMAAMTLVPSGDIVLTQDNLLATDGLAAAVIVGTLVILGIALTGSNIERALTKRTLANEALQEAISMRDEFLSIASHELRTPLTSIKLQNDLLLKKLHDDSIDSQKIINTLEKSGKNLNRISLLVDDMLDISRLSSGKLSLQREHFDLVQLTNEVLEKLQPLLQEAGCLSRLEGDSSVSGEWDKFRIEQVITNLLTNAAKYASGKPIVVKVVQNIGEAILSVKDQGPGIAEEDQARIFNRFERAKTTEFIKGLGLGLFITQEILDMHGGKINVKSSPGEGAEFIVSLPL